MAMSGSVLRIKTTLSYTGVASAGHTSPCCSCRESVIILEVAYNRKAACDCNA